MAIGKKSDLINIMEAQLTTGQLHGLLKKYKPTHEEEIRLTGNKEHLIDELIKSVNAGIIPKIELWSLIRESEEFGNQYIYLFRTSNDYFDRTYNQHEKIKNKLIKGVDQGKFPRILQMPTKMEWVDFRQNDRNVNDSWLGKIYDKKSRERKISERATGKRRVVTYEVQDHRVIYLAYWNGNGFLEYRIGRTTFDSLKSTQQTLEKVQRKFGIAINHKNHFVPWNLNKAIHEILTNYEKNSKIYTLLSTKLEDAQRGKANISAFDDSVDLFANNARKIAINAYLQNDGFGRGLVVTFKQSGSDGLLNSDIKVILGRDAPNQIIIGSKILFKEYEYIKRKIETFNR